jgi:hypothetical protein
MYSMNSMTCVSGYWKVNNKHGTNYNSWFNCSLKINCPYIFFGDKESIEMIKHVRNELPTFYIECTIETFVTYKYKHLMITDPGHCPSVELNLIWNEKIFLIEKALELNPFQSEFFCWVDAGICIYRTTPPPNIPFPNVDKLSLLPKDKFIFTSSLPYNEDNIVNTINYHYISGTSYILHKQLINDFARLYEKYLDKLVNTNNIWTDQVVLSHIYINHKQLFHKLGDGYGEICRLLF